MDERQRPDEVDPTDPVEGEESPQADSAPPPVPPPPDPLPAAPPPPAPPPAVPPTVEMPTAEDLATGAATPPIGRQKLHLIDLTFRTTFGALAETLGVTALVHLPLFLLLGVVVILLAAGMISDDVAAAGGTMVVFGTLVMSPISAAALVHGVFARLRGEPMDVRTSIRTALRRLGPVILLAILTGLAVLAGLLLCVIPGIVIACGLFIATPALLVEKVGVDTAMRRSWNLADGYKLPIFGLLFVLSMLETALSGVIEQVMLTSAAGTGWAVLLYLTASLTGGILLTALRSVGAVVAYFQIRKFREGLDEDELAEIFA